MHVYIPVIASEGLDSPISQHFGSAPRFVVCDSPQQEPGGPDGDRGDEDDGICPCGTPGFPGAGVDAIVCVGMGDRAWRQFSSRGIPVYVAQAPSAGAALASLQDGRGIEVVPHRCCLDRLWGAETPNQAAGARS